MQMLIKEILWTNDLVNEYSSKTPFQTWIEIVSAGMVWQEWSDNYPYFSCLVCENINMLCGLFILKGPGNFYVGICHKTSVLLNED